ncbi:MAG TPA: iron ABC transporter permease [Thiotrichaceae bacterium]|jgi:iron(III) transport system permease protein|nr:iron ABC transporter permease [Thiotrichaceae bacterium]HIM09058.1 iron ABC transporter permease [Gammaproteobacteria bacterium]
MLVTQDSQAIPNSYFKLVPFSLTKWNSVLVLLSLLFSIPLAVILGSLFFPQIEVWSHLADTVLSDYIVSSLALFLGVGFFSLILGVIPAWLVTMYRFPMSRYLEWALLLPMAMPAYIIAYSYTGMLDVAGPLQSSIRELTGWQYRDYWFPEIRSLGGAITMLSLVLYPYVYLLARAAFIEQSTCVLEVSRTLGCNAANAFRRVALPLARPAIMVGLSLVVMETLADYGTVQYFGVSAFTTGIFRTWFGLGNSLAAAQLSVLLLIFVAVFLYLEKRSRRQAKFYNSGSRYSSLMQQQLNKEQGIFSLVLCATPMILGFIIPIMYLMNLALDTYSEVLGKDFYMLLFNSLSLALVTAVLALCIALFMAYSNRNTHSSLNRFLVRFVSMGYAIPGTVIAVGVLIPFAWFDNTLDAFLTEHFNISSGLLISGTVVTLIFAYLTRFLAVSINTVESALVKIKPVMDEVAKTTGINSANIIKRIHIPMMRGSLLTALLLVFVDVLKELPATLILRPFNFNTLAVRTYELANEERLADAAVPALAIVLVGIIPVIIISNSISRSRAGNDPENDSGK